MSDHRPAAPRRKLSLIAPLIMAGVLAATLLYAVLIGPVVQFFLPMLTVRLNAPSPPGGLDPEPEGEPDPIGS